MASGWITEGALAVADGRIDLDTTVLKIMLLKSSYALDQDQDAVDDGSADDLLSHELVATNYAGGHGGAGRKTATITLDKTTGVGRMVRIAIADLTWLSLGGGTNDTIGYIALIKPGTADDTDAIPVAVWDVTDTPTNGGNITLDFAALAAGGNLQLAV